MAQQQQEQERARDVGMQTGRDPIVLAAAASVLLSWFQYYVRGNREHGLFIGLWPPTMLAFSNAVRINEISRKVESKTSNLLDWITENR
jgi:hypothetical protein